MKKQLLAFYATEPLASRSSPLSFSTFTRGSGRLLNNNILEEARSKLIHLLATIKRFSFDNLFNGIGSRQQPIKGIFNKLILEIPHYVTFYLEVYMEGKQQYLTDCASAMNSGGLICSRHYY